MLTKYDDNHEASLNGNEHEFCFARVDIPAMSENSTSICAFQRSDLWFTGLMPSKLMTFRHITAQDSSISVNRT